MSINTATYVANYDDGATKLQPTTMVLARVRVNNASLYTYTQNGILDALKQAHLDQHGVVVEARLYWTRLRLAEVEGVPKSEPSGCACDCKTCDEQGWHCHKAENECYL